MAKPTPDLRDIAAETVRRVGPDSINGYIPLSDLPTAEERLQFAAAALQGITVLLVPREPMSEEEWVERYCTNRH